MKVLLCFAFLAVLACAWATVPAPEQPAAEPDSRDKRGLLLGDYVLPSYGYNGFLGRSYGYGLPTYSYNYGLPYGYRYAL